MKTIKEEIVFDGMNLRFRDIMVGRAPDDIVMSGAAIPKDRLDNLKDKIILDMKYAGDTR